MSPTILILGAGSNVGAHVARTFRKQGFKVAVAARSVKKDVEDTADIFVKADFAEPASIKSVFEEVKSKLGTPSVVVYNAAFMKATAPTDTLSVPLADFSTAIAVGTTSVFAAAQETVAGFKQLPTDTLKSFIFTGNCLNIKPMTPLLSLGMQKAATAHMIQSAALSYADNGYHFYFADQRKSDGGPVGNAVSGPAHADFYYELAQKNEQGPWDATFVDGKGYVDFAGKTTW